MILLNFGNLSYVSTTKRVFITSYTLWTLVMVEVTGQRRFTSSLLDDRKAVPVSHHYAKKRPFRSFFFTLRAFSRFESFRFIIIKKQKPIIWLLFFLANNSYIDTMHGRCIFWWVKLQSEKVKFRSEKDKFRCKAADCSFIKNDI